ncbi:MAG: sugar transferase [bacterium]
MGRWHWHKVNPILYYLLRAVILVTLVLLGNRLLPLSVDRDSLLTLLYLALIIQLALLIRLPSNDIVPARNRLIDSREHFKEELLFPLVFTTSVFFLGMELPATYLGILLALNFALQTILFLIGRKLSLQSRISPSGTDLSGAKNILIAGAGPRGRRAAEHLLRHPELNVRIIGFVDPHRRGLWRFRDIPLLGHPDNIAAVISRNHIDYVVMANEPSDFEQSRATFEIVEQMGIKICLLPDIYERSISKCRPFALNGQPVLLYHSVPENRAAILAKKILDRVGAALGIILAAPLLLITAIAIKIDSEGPVIYRQKRTGCNGRVFDMFKFRTMTNGAERLKEQLQHLNEMSGPVFKIKNDPRVTRIGRFLRKYSIDELPQLFNVLKGDMSLVGPRPPLPREVEQYAPWQHRRLSVKPGVTCLWQVNGRNKIDFEEWMKLDLQYIDRWSLKEDIRILAKTVPTVLKGSGS